MNNPQQPGKYDAVLGGNSPSLEGAAVLGGIEGVKLRLQNPDLKVRIAALEQALNYGEQGLDLVLIEGLNDESVEVQNAAYFLLKFRKEIKVKQALIIFDKSQLKSAYNKDYTTLLNLLANENWKEADAETGRVMLSIANSIHPARYRNYFHVYAMPKFPCEDLRTIDQLWVKYSDGHFGLSVQKKIYQGLVGTRDYDNMNIIEKDKIWDDFYDLVGWRTKRGYSASSLYDITFEKTAKQGHLPTIALLGGHYTRLNGCINIRCLTSRLTDCQI
jgi:hypothetical protein